MMIRAPCMFCGSACLLDFVVEKGKIKSVLPVKEDPVSEGRPCIKGLALKDVQGINRVTVPLVREGDGFTNVSWDYALEEIKDALENVAPERTAWIGSGEITNEDNYIIQKFAREVVGSDNVDNCARLCHAPTVKAYREMFGVPASPDFENSIYDLDVLLCVGTNPATNYPTIFTKILNAKREGGLTLLSVNVWENETTDLSDLKVIVPPGTMAVFLAGVARELVVERGIESKVEGFEAFRASVEPYTYDAVRKVTGKGKKDIKAFADVIEDSKSFGVMHGMKFTQTYHGTDSVKLLTAIAVIKNGKILTMRGKVNVQGAGDMGCAPVYGKTLIDAFILDPVDFAFISVFNPARSMPALNRVWENMRKMFVVHATPYLNATSEYADIVLPVPLLIERVGTITNAERRIRLVRRVVDPPGHARQEWEFLTELAHEMGVEWEFTGPKDVFYEITERVDGFMHLDPERIYNGEEAFAEKGVRFVRLFPVNISVHTYPGYPYTLVTTRRLTHFNTGDVTTKIEALRRGMNKNVAWMNPADMKKEGLKDGEVAVLASPEASVEITVKASPKVPKGVVTTTFHFEDVPVNVLAPVDLDPETKIPSFKTVPVRVIRKK